MRSKEAENKTSSILPTANVGSALTLALMAAEENPPKPIDESKTDPTNFFDMFELFFQNLMRWQG